ncbi:hypothetical protein [Georgenia faecalis]|uniref:Serine protease n=1 Tax=Georgenia faecalis TaxID=2483799 RepID=A0ABV9D9K5_9MICO|nr:hypothetical protein [Georgenia faecalis]
MDLEEARTLKRQLVGYVDELLATRARPATAPAGGDARGVGAAVASLAPVGVALGLAPRGDGGVDIALRYTLGTPTARMVARRLAGEVGPGLDVRRTGRIRPLASGSPRPPVATAQATGETGRVRPLRPGVSIAHYAVSAGTLGAFVTLTGGTGVHALSNFHVLAGSPDARVGDDVLQPGSADGGRLPEDRVGALAAWVPVAPGAPLAVDAAVAALDDPVVEAVYPGGPLAGPAPATGEEEVEKIGRTTGVTRGRVTALELDGVVVDYGPGIGDLQFDNQIEVEAAGPEPFSRGGDSGALVYRPSDRRAIGLLFAGSETGGENGTGLTYVNPIAEVLTALGATLV